MHAVIEKPTMQIWRYLRRGPFTSVCDRHSEFAQLYATQLQMDYSQGLKEMLAKAIRVR
jgi:hypothetical protein